MNETEIQKYTDVKMFANSIFILQHRNKKNCGQQQHCDIDSINTINFIIIISQFSGRITYCKP